jgi:hypothetical protein
MQSSKIDILKILEDKLQNKPVQVLPGVLGTAAVKTSSGSHRDVFQTLVDADEKTAVTAITGIDLGTNLGVFYHVRTSNAFLTIQAEVPKTSAKLKTVIDIAPSATFHELEVTSCFLTDGQRAYTPSEKMSMQAKWNSTPRLLKRNPTKANSSK